MTHDVIVVGSGAAGLTAALGLAERLKVLVLAKGDSLAYRPVKLGRLSDDGLRIVQSGLEPGEKVVVEGQYRLTQGARVRLSSPKSGAAG